MEAWWHGGGYYHEGVIIAQTTQNQWLFQIDDKIVDLINSNQLLIGTQRLSSEF